MAYGITVTRQDAAAPSLFWSTFWDEAEQLGEWRIAPQIAGQNTGGLDADAQIASAVVISLFTDLEAPEGWRPDVTDRRGWWGDHVAPEGEEPEPIGSHLWLLRNEVATEAVALQAQRYAEAALAWMIRDRVAATVTVTTGVIENPRRGLWLAVDILGRDGAIAYSRRFARLWQDELR